MVKYNLCKCGNIKYESSKLCRKCFSKDRHKQLSKTDSLMKRRRRKEVCSNCGEPNNYTNFKSRQLTNCKKCNHSLSINNWLFGL
jgi:hypothetical protein